MDELNLQALLLDESFINYCKRTNKADIEKWEKWLQKYPEHKESVAELKETIVTMGYHAGELAVQTNYARLQSQIKKRSNQHRFATIGTTVWFKVAAAIIAVSAISLFLFRQQTPKESTEIVQHVGAPGKDAALLTLKDGSVVSLADIKNGSVVALQGGVEIQKNKDGELVYRAIEQGDATNPAINTIATNKGNQYQVILPDGSKAFLNANSTLTYPLRFFKDARSVRMTGEIYFEIAKVESGTSGRQKRIPFYVETENQKIEVLGTHFNVNAYEDEPATTTTLLEGSVRVISKKRSESVLLKPGERALLNETLRVEDVDVSQEVAWINGDFIFKGEELGSLLRKISRWYNVEIECPEKLDKLKFDGMVSRSQPLSTIIDMLQTTGKVKLILNGRRLIVID
ncbi:FecR domain-containing protein [Sphingobacterium sp.]|uniref:FecR family protein n=1 Tax=Sphingobacterium sp. TaxID=341027 RepID=UPI0028966D90|nr:FecR domain-containing protein [Sphingobacterium sp.]